MNPQQAFYRKVAYVAAIVVLLLPLYLLGHPPTRDTRDAKGSGAAGPRQPRLVIARRPWRTPHDTVKAPEANRARCEPCAQLGSQPTRVLASQEAAAPTPEQPAREASKGRSMPEEPRSTATGSWGRMPGRRRVLDNRDALAGAGDAAGAFARMRVRPSVISQSCPA